MSEKDKLFKCIRYILIGAVTIIILKYALSFGIALRLYLDNKETLSSIEDLSNIDTDSIIHNVTGLDDKQEFENYLNENNLGISILNYYFLIEKYNLFGYTRNDFVNLDSTIKNNISQDGGQLGQYCLDIYFNWNETK